MILRPPEDLPPGVFAVSAPRNRPKENFLKNRLYSRRKMAYNGQASLFSDGGSMNGGGIAPWKRTEKSPSGGYGYER